MYINITNPHYLWLLFSVPFLIFSHLTLLRYNQYRALRFANFAALKRVTGKKILSKNYIMLTLRMLILLSLIFALSRPVLWYESEVSNYDYVIAIDSSASMSAQDFQPTRLQAAKDTASSFVDSLPPGARIGVIRFAGSTFVELIPDKSKLKVKQAIDDITLMRAGGTDIPGSIITGSNLLLNSMDGRGIILLTDGSNTAGTFLQDSIDEATNYARDKNVVIHAIGIGSESGPIGYLPEYYNISATYNQDSLETITEDTGGLFFYASDYEDITASFSNIINHDKTAFIDLEMTFGLTALALVLVFIEWGLINTRFRRFP
ncbi:MAG: VWA domain-containing protein [Nanoarchaeota archaeon]|nr:VWA domain-containing protein [Nanoarchaeota archaeon]